MLPNRKVRPTNVATATRLPSLYDSTSMPNQIHSAPKATINHQAADASRVPAALDRVAQRFGVFAFIGHCARLLGDAARLGRQPFLPAAGALVL